MLITNSRAGHNCFWILPPQTEGENFHDSVLLYTTKFSAQRKLSCPSSQHLISCLDRGAISDVFGSEEERSRNKFSTSTACLRKLGLTEQASVTVKPARPLKTDSHSAWHYGYCIHFVPCSLSGYLMKASRGSSLTGSEHRLPHPACSGALATTCTRVFSLELSFLLQNSL